MLAPKVRRNFRAVLIVVPKFYRPARALDYCGGVTGTRFGQESEMKRKVTHGKPRTTMLVRTGGPYAHD
jgi:hypothetical protein